MLCILISLYSQIDSIGTICDMYKIIWKLYFLKWPNYLWKENSKLCMCVCVCEQMPGPISFVHIFANAFHGKNRIRTGNGIVAKGNKHCTNCEFVNFELFILLSMLFVFVGVSELVIIITLCSFRSFCKI